MPTSADTIYNPRTGQWMTFLQTARDTSGDLLRVETVNPPSAHGEPEHVHPRQESRAEVLAGALTFDVAGTVRTVRAGETIVIPANTPHRFWNDGPEDARAIQELRPALRTEEFFRMWFGLAQDGRLDERGMPPFLQLMAMTPAFADVMRPTRPPWPLLRALALVLAPLARLRGYRGVDPRYVTASAEPAAT